MHDLAFVFAGFFVGLIVGLTGVGGGSLVSRLLGQGREDEADRVFGDVGSLLARYPSVWLLWSKIAAVRSKDPSLAMLFLAHYFQNETLTWSEVVERGLQSLGQAGRDVVAINPKSPGRGATLRIVQTRRHRQRWIKKCCAKI